MSKDYPFITNMSDEVIDCINKMLSKRPNYKIEQINGQRLYRPENDEQLAEPKRGSEVFVGALPRDCYENELIPIFEQIGEIRRMRLMMDFSGTNRGYAYVVYNDPETAKLAAERLDGYEVRPNRAIGVAVSYDKRRLFIGGIPKHKKKKDVLKEMKKVTEGVKDVILYMSVYNQKNRGFCFVEYETHRDAAMARRRMGEGFTLWSKHEVRVDWADPEPQVDEEVMSKVRIIHIRNLPLSVTEEDLKEIFSFEGLHIERVKKIRDFAFIHYETRADTEKAMEISNCKEFGKKHPTLQRIQVSLARPPKSKLMRRRVISSTDSGPTDLSNSSSTPTTTQMLYPLNVRQTQIDNQLNQLRYYQNLFQNQQMGEMPLNTPLKYDPLLEDKNSFNFFVVWVPVVWLPQNNNNNNNKDLILDENTIFCSNN